MKPRAYSLVISDTTFYNVVRYLKIRDGFGVTSNNISFYRSVHSLIIL